MAKNDGATFG